MIKVKEVVSFLESVAPPAYQESYDNSGLLTGSPDNKVSNILVTLDCTEEVIREARQKGCEMVVAHHPVIFRGLKSLTGKNYVERTVIEAVKNDIAIYAIHTNLDNVLHGVNHRIAEKLSLKNLKILSPKSHILKKIVVFIPVGDTDKVLEGLYQAGAGNIGNYSGCSFRLEGTGTFKPDDNANPAIGESGKQEYVRENRAELIFPAYLESKILKALYQYHPYEEPAYDIFQLENPDFLTGSGTVGELEDVMSQQEFLKYLKKNMNLEVIRFTKGSEKNIKKVAVCGGAGSFLLPKAIAAGSDVFITGDFKYHEFFDAENKIMIADIGHYESEVFTKDLLYDYLKNKFANIAVTVSNTNTNPISYLY